VAVEEFDELTMTNIADLAQNNGRREPQSHREAIIEFVSEIMSVKLLGSIRFVTRLVF